MVRFAHLLAVVLVVGAFLAVPVLAEKGQAKAPEIALLDLEEPLFTPLEGPQQQGLITVEDLAKIHFIRECEYEHEWAQCPPECNDCIFSGGIVYCVNC